MSIIVSVFLGWFIGMALGIGCLVIVLEKINNTIKTVDGKRQWKI
jgi:hypothetical protein